MTDRDATAGDGRLRRLGARARTVRGRSALVAAVVVAVALVGGAIGSVIALRSSLTDGLDRTLLQQAQDRAQLIDGGTDPASLTATLQEEALVWIGRPDGTTIASGSVLTPLESPVPDELNGVGAATLLVEERKPNETERERMDLRLASATTSDGRIVVLAGAETEGIDEAASEAASLFALGIPVISLLVGAIAWAAVGRALRPVDAIRRQTLTVTGSSLSDRVPVPSGRDEIHDLAITMNDMLERLDAHHLALRQFTADASHELKSPVANLRALAETSELDDPAWPDLQRRLGHEADRLRDLVDNLLFLAAHDDPGSPGRADHRRVDLDDLVFAEAELLAATGRVRVDLTQVEPASTVGDPAALTRMLRNLADNAARHASSTVFLGLAEGRDGTVRLHVADDGPGIAVDDRERVFERFTRLDDARDRDGGGAGLGLAIVREIVADHGGDVTIDDRAGGGARVTVVLPAG